VEAIHVQQPSYTDLETLATLLQHGDCVVANAGTILLDSLVNDRPAVCVLYDEGAPPGERWASLNTVGEHYRQLMESEAFYRAERFEDVVAGIDRALAAPGELAAERARVAREVVDEVDGRAAERVVDAVLEALS
jgi:CDP-glycerol glycerophosphotransferase (TagB/SpsB family)